MATSYTSYGTVYANTKAKMATVETALNAGGLAIAYNDDMQSGTIIEAVTTADEDETATGTDTNNLIAGTTAPEAVAEPVTEEEATEDSTDEETADSE